MIHRVVEEFERQSLHLSQEENEQIQRLLRRYEPVLRFHEGERFFPVSAVLYLLFSTVWYIPLRSREGEKIVESPYKKRSKPRLLELLLNRPHIQLNTEVDQEIFGEGPASDGYVRVQHARHKRGQTEQEARSAINQARRLLESRLRRFRAAWLNPGMLFLHFAETIMPWGRRPLRHWFLPRGSDLAAKQKYDELTWQNGQRDTCYYGRVVDQCGYRAVQYWFFYAFNDFRTAVRGANNHEGDWECITVYLTPEGDRWRPNCAAFSSHHTKQIVPWEEVECEDEAREHVVGYVARGSHASYPARAKYPLGGVWPFKMHDYALGDGEQIGPGTWGTPRILAETGPDWLFFDGFWGAYIRDLSMRENAPRGPLYTIEPGFHRPVPRQKWYNPVRWASLECLGGPDCDHELRGYYSYPSTSAAWQEDWGTDQEWDAWADTVAI